MKTPVHAFVVTVMADATEEQARRYVRDAIVYHGGGGTPQDPFFALQFRHVTVRYAKAKKPGASK